MSEVTDTAEPAAEAHVKVERILFLRNVRAGYVTRANGRDRLRLPDGRGRFAPKQVKTELEAQPGATIFLGHSGQYRLTPFGEAILNRVDQARAARNTEAGRA